MNENQEPEINKRELIIFGAIVLVSVLGIISYQVGYRAGVGSVNAEEQTKIVQQDNTEEQKVEEDASPREPIELSGSGQQATDKIELVYGVATVKMTHNGDSNFIVHVIDSEGEDIEGLVNEIGNFDGSKAFKVPADGKYILDVSASGPWTISIQQ